MNAYNGQRIGAATVALGLAAGAYELALAYARNASSSAGRSASSRACSGCWPTWRRRSRRRDCWFYKAAAGKEDGFPDLTEAAQAKIFTSEMAIKVTNDALQVFGAAGYSRNRPLERMVRDARMFTIGGGTAQILRTVVASRLLGRKLPQSRDGYSERSQPR